MTKEITITRLGFSDNLWPRLSILYFSWAIFFIASALSFYPYSVMANFSMKLASTVSATAIVASSMSASLVSAASEFLPYAEALATNKVIGTQTTEAGYRLNDQITRAELAKVAANLGQYTPVSCTGTVFADVTSSLGDLCDAIETLAKAGVISTANTNFRPTANVTRAEMTKMLLGAVGEKPSEKSAGYTDVTSALGDLAGFINRANEMKCANTATYFRPNANSSRGEAFKIASCTAGLKVETTKTEDKPVATTGAVTVTQVGAATAQYVPMNASSVKVGTVKLTANGGDATVSSLSVTRSGLGDSRDIVSTNGIRAAQNGAIVSSNSDYYNSTSQKGNIYFHPALTIKAGQSVDLDILVSLNDNAQPNSQHQFAVDAVNSQAVTPVTLGLINTTSYKTSEVTVAGNYSYTINPGRSQQTFAKVDVTSGNRDTTINGFTLTRVNGTDLTRRLANVNVYANGTKVGTATVTADKIIVTGLATNLDAGNFQSYELRGDALVDGSSSNNALSLEIQNSTDVSATERATGYATRTAGKAVSTVAFSGVDITFTNDTTADQTVSPGTSNVTLYNGKVTSSVPFTVKQLTITPAGTNVGTKAFSNETLSVRVNGSEIATITAAEFASNSTGAITKNISFPVDAATPATITIVANSVLNNTAIAGDYKFTVKLSDVRDAANNVVTTTSNTNVGYKTTIQAPTLTIQNATVAAPSNRTLSNVSNQEAGRFGLRAATSDITVSKLTLTATVTGATLSDIVNPSNIQLWDVAENKQIASSVNVSGNVVTFDSMSVLVNKDTTKNLKVVFAAVNDLSGKYGAQVSFDVTTGTTTAATTGTVTCQVDNNGAVVQGTCTTVAPATNSATANVVANAVNGPTVAVNKATLTMATYNAGIVPPTVKVTANTLDQNSKIATIRVTNVDTNSEVTIQKIKLQFAARSTANGQFSFNGKICLREIGSTNSCAADAPAVTQAGGVYTFDVSALDSAKLDKNSGYVDYEVYVDGAPLWVAGDNANVTVTEITHSKSTTPQSYVGVSEASATATK